MWTLQELRERCSPGKWHDAPRYCALAVITARNLGHPDAEPSLSNALQWLHDHALEADEPGVVAEINACRDLVPEQVCRCDRCGAVVAAGMFLCPKCSGDADG